MKKILPLLLLCVFLFQSCKIYDSKTATKEDALLSEGKVRVKSISNTNYKFEKLVEEENQLYGIGKRQSGKTKEEFNKNIVNENPTDKNVKILLTNDLVDEIHLFNEGKTKTLKTVGIGVGAIWIAVVLLGGALVIGALGGF